MKALAIIIISLLVMALAFILVVAIPVFIGKLLFHWSKQRVKYIVSNSLSTIFTSLITSLIITGLILLIGILFKQQWAFSGGLLIVYVFWMAIKTVSENIKNSKRM